jgi:integrase
MKLSLTSKFIESLKATGKRQEFVDARVRGLVLRVSGNGVRAWSVSYRNSAGGKQRVTIGTFPEFGLDDARQAALLLTSRIARGEDPAGAKRAEGIAPLGTTFRQLFEMRMSQGAGAGRKTSVKTSTVAFYRGIMAAKPNSEPSVLDQLGDLAADAITPQQIVAVLDKIEARGARAQADHVKAALSGTFAWAQKRHAVNLNPFFGLGKRAQSTPRTKVPTDAEVRAMWLAEAPSGAAATRVQLSAEMHTIIRLAILTGQRRAEVCGARVEELALDVDKPLWTIAGDTISRGKTATLARGRTKNSREQSVPLSVQAVALWREALKSARNGYVFPARLDTLKAGAEPKHPHIDPHSVSTAMRRMRHVLKIDDVTVHDMRRAISTWAGDNGIRPDVIDRILNHAPLDVTRRHYNHSTLDPLVRQAMQAWADHIEGLVTGKSLAASNVTTLADRRAAGGTA